MSEAASSVPYTNLLRRASGERVVIVGGGLAGVSTLYELTSRGIAATLLESRAAVAEEASFANGGMLTPSMPDPWNGPGVARHLFSSLFDETSSFKLHWREIPGLANWGIQFLYNSRPIRHQSTTLANYRLASYSIACLQELCTHNCLIFDCASRGTMKIFEDEADMLGPAALAERLRPLGLQYSRLDRKEVFALEPQLHAAKARIAGALYFPNDQTGDARKFTFALAAKAESLGGEIRTRTQVRGIVRSGGRIRGVETDSDMIEGEVVIAAGVDAPILARQLDIGLPIKPAKGYSITMDASRLNGSMPKIAVIDDAAHAAVVPLGDRLRLVGMAEFAGRDKSIEQKRADMLFALFDRMYPHLANEFDRRDAQIWVGLRPMTADGAPIIGPSPLRGLWFNCGHGHLGWTMATGSARVLVDLMEGKPPTLDPTPYIYPRSRRSSVDRGAKTYHSSAVRLCR